MTASDGRLFTLRRLPPLAAVAAALSVLGCGRPRALLGQATNGGTTPATQALFRDVARAAGLDFRLGHASTAGLTLLDTIGHGCAFLDYDGDGRPDILLVGNAGPRLYHNEGSGRFLDVTARVLPPPPAEAHFLGCAVGDYDSDGRPDIYLTGYGTTALLHNEGGQRFRDVTRGSGLEARGPHDWTTSAAWADVDGDGRLDLFVCRYVEFNPKTKQLCAYHGLDGQSIMMACAPGEYAPQRGSLYRNEGGGHFRDITDQAGMAGAHGAALGCMFCDYDGDGRPDLFVANDRRPADMYHNLGGGRFENVAVQAGTAYGADGSAMSGMGIDWGDYDGDGRPDLLVSNYAGNPKALYHNQGGGRFVDDTFQSGVGPATMLPLTFGAYFVDVENRGILDIVLSNGHVQGQAELVDSATTYRESAILLRGDGQGHFEDESPRAGADFTRAIVGRGIAVADYDSDGRLDLLIVNDEGQPLLLHNESHPSGHWLTVRCKWGPGRTDAIGATITVVANGRRQTTEIHTTGSYLSADLPVAHFGLAEATSADVTVRWPNGRADLWRGLQTSHAYEATPGHCTAVPAP